jgi:hypothetical protein
MRLPSSRFFTTYSQSRRNETQQNGAQFEKRSTNPSNLEPATSSDVNSLFKHANNNKIKSQVVDNE